jgi:hypothetical protein
VTTGLAETDTALAGYQARVLEMRRSPYID